MLLQISLRFWVPYLWAYTWFSQFLSLDFHSPLNPASYYYFTAFALIFVTRILHSLIVYRKPHQLKSIIFLDGVVLVFSIFVVVLGFL